MRVSVIIPVFNAELFVERAINSALIQTEVAEVVCIDDLSTDKSYAICQRMASSDNRVISVKNNTGVKGAGAARNVGLELVSSEFVAYLDADDEWYENRFNNTKKIFSLYQATDAVLESIASIELNNNKKIIYGHNIDNSRILYKDYLINSSALITGLTIKRKSLNTIGKFDINLIQTQDTDLIFRIVKNLETRSGVKSNPIGIYRIHDKNSTNNLYDRYYFRSVFYKKEIIYSLKNNLSFKELYYLLFFYTYNQYKFTYHTQIKNKFISKYIFIPYYLYKIFF